MGRVANLFFECDKLSVSKERTEYYKLEKVPTECEFAKLWKEMGSVLFLQWMVRGLRRVSDEDENLGTGVWKL